MESGSASGDAEGLSESGSPGETDTSTGDGGAPTGGGGAGSSGPDVGDGGDSMGGEGDDRVPADVGDGSDDDIVARQLREAAMKEEDPELRERLWDEYRAYKAGSKG